MGGISGMLGLSGGAGGTGFSGPQAAPIVSPATTAQANEQYKNAQNALAQQQAFVQATQAQNGLGNQSSVYNQMQGVANGTGPNPAQAQLAQATGANVANQAAIMAGQRGSNSNVGMIARQAAMQGANTQQQSAGQAATLQAQQSLGALQNMGSMANTQVAQQQQATQGYNQAVQGEQSNILNSIAGVNSANVGMQSNINNANMAGVTSTQGLMGSLLGGAAQGAGMGMAMAAEGGKVETPSTIVPDLMPLSSKKSGNEALYKGASSFGKFLASKSPKEEAGAGLEGTLPSGPGGVAATPVMAEGGRVPAMVSPGEQYLPPKDVKKVKEGKDPLSVGERIPGKPKVKGNSYANDTVPKTLESGGIVIPNSVMQSKNPHEEAMKFVHATIAKNGKSLPKKSK